MTKQNRVSSRAIFYMLISAVSFAFMGVAVKGAGDLPVFQTVFFRNLVMMIIISTVLWGKGRTAFWGKRENRPYLIVRSLLGMVGVVCYFYALPNLNLADSTMLNKLSPFFVTIFAALFLREKMTKVQIPALLIAFFGAMLIIKPRFDLSVLPALAGLSSAVFAGGAYTIIRFLKGREGANTVIFWFSFISTLGMIPFTIVSWVMPTGWEWFALVSTGVSAAGGQFFLTRAYQNAPAGEISIYNYTHIIFSGILGFLFFGEIPDGLSFLGGGLIIAVALGLFLVSRRNRKVLM